MYAKRTSKPLNLKKGHYRYIYFIHRPTLTCTMWKLTVKAQTYPLTEIR